jgi:hypothetical protein
MNLPILEVLWLDAWSDGELDENPAEWKTSCRVTTVGYLVRDDQVLSVAQEWVADAGVWRNVTHIPSGLVIDRKVLAPRVFLRDPGPKMTA